MAVLEPDDLETIRRECERVSFGKVIVTLHRDAVVTITTEVTRRVMNRPKGHIA